MLDPEIQDILERVYESDANDVPVICAAGARPVLGHVYAAWNPLFGHLIKIGATTRQPYVRVEELSRLTGVPEPFHLVSSLHTTSPFVLEHEIHDHFASVRKYGKKKEFFLLDKPTVSNHFLSQAKHAMSIPIMVKDTTKHKKKKAKKAQEDQQPNSGPSSLFSTLSNQDAELLRNTVKSMVHEALGAAAGGGKPEEGLNKVDAAAEGPDQEKDTDDTVKGNTTTSFEHVLIDLAFSVHMLMCFSVSCDLLKCEVCVFDTGVLMGESVTKMGVSDDALDFGEKNQMDCIEVR